MERLQSEALNTKFGLRCRGREIQKFIELKGQGLLFWLLKGDFKVSSGIV